MRQPIGGKFKHASSPEIGAAQKRYNPPEGNCFGGVQRVADERRYWGFVNTLPAPALVAVAQQAEAQGLEGLFAPQVYGPPWIPLAAAATATERPLRQEIPIWIAALRAPAVRLAAEIGDGVMGHPMWSLDWATERIQPDIQIDLERGGRSRADIELNLWLWCAPSTDEEEAIEDARTTVAFYAGMAQYFSFFEAHGFADEARRLQEYVRKREIADHARLVPDEMVRTFVVCGKPDEVRGRIERAWSVADSLCLVPPAYGLGREKLAHYSGEIAKLFYD